ncbi:hypothetical protein QO010_000384 [Caulobacter ginsengisoli]|uniref:Uncharacterized protein n=1 Tax=Caulobacter ginsengisoli TaxID=400775 RepID=A0ABU0IKU6_9CAUL|nr:hypothetical protein [Caulobacter ginsengisoli]MDQ0462636.1 hypothetical protein [Caulobacter ginsengisoli]
MTAFAAAARFSRGETFTVALRIAAGDLAGAICRMALKRAPGDSNPELAVLETTYLDHVDTGDLTSPPGWSGTLAAEVSETLPAGHFVMDARVEKLGVVIQTDPVAVEITERVTGGA